jgi:membrane protein YdbS with pleckstrin-like domain
MKEEKASARMMILVIGLVVIIVVIGGVFWLWLQATHGEVGPALVATALSLVVIFVALYFTLQLQKRGGDEEGRMRETLPADAGALPERPPERPDATRVSG